VGASVGVSVGALLGASVPQRGNSFMSLLSYREETATCPIANDLSELEVSLQHDDQKPRSVHALLAERYIVTHHAPFFPLT
jgi:hypothetical protein